jgi:hypothetical protein
MAEFPGGGRNFGQPERGSFRSGLQAVVQGLSSRLFGVSTARFQGFRVYRAVPQHMQQRSRAWRVLCLYLLQPQVKRDLPFFSATQADTARQPLQYNLALHKIRFCKHLPWRMPGPLTHFRVPRLWRLAALGVLVEISTA